MLQVFVNILVVAIAALAFVVYSSDLDPEVFSLPPNPPTLVPNDALANAELLWKYKVKGPESVVAGKGGERLYLGVQNGKILSALNKKGSHIDFTARTGDHSKVLPLPCGTYETIETCGRPLGMAFNQQNELVYCDGAKGLVKMDNRRYFQVLVDQVGDRPLKFANDLAIAKDGMIYFSESTSKYSIRDLWLQLMEAKPLGNLLRYNPVTKEVTILTSGLRFANGVSLLPDESAVLVADTVMMRIERHYLTGAKKGTSDTFIDNLPCMPDNIDFVGTELFVACPSDRAGYESLISKPWLRKILSKIGPFDSPNKYGMVLRISLDGKLVGHLQDTSGRLSLISDVTYINGYLYFGSYASEVEYVGRIPWTIKQ